MEKNEKQKKEKKCFFFDSRFSQVLISGRGEPRVFKQD